MTARWDVLAVARYFSEDTQDNDLLISIQELIDGFELVRTVVVSDEAMREARERVAGRILSCIKTRMHADEWDAWLAPHPRLTAAEAERYLALAQTRVRA